MTAPQDPRTAADWPVPEEAVQAALDYLYGEDVPEADTRHALAAAAPYIVAATLRQAAVRLSADALAADRGHARYLYAAAADLNRWADEVQP